MLLLSIANKHKALTNVKVGEGYRRCNPSILKTETGYKLIVRSVNYTIQNDHDYIPKDPHVQTVNYLVTIDKDWNVASQIPLEDHSDRTQYLNYIRGLEDCRLLTCGDKTYVTATCLDHSLHGMPETVLMTLNENKLNDFVVCKPGYLDTKHKEKNWLPFGYDDKCCVIYQQWPLTIHSLHNDGTYSVVKTTPSPDIAQQFRGSCGPVQWKDGWLYMIHEVTYYPVWIYKHRFVWLNKEWEMKLFTEPFSFEHTGIEFAAGLSLSHNDNCVIITYGIRDGEAYMMEVNVDKLPWIK